MLRLGRRPLFIKFDPFVILKLSKQLSLNVKVWTCHFFFYAAYHAEVHSVLEKFLNDKSGRIDLDVQTYMTQLKSHLGNSQQPTVKSSGGKIASSSSSSTSTSSSSSSSSSEEKRKKSVKKKPKTKEPKKETTKDLATNDSKKRKRKK
jgi:hypothetical protein